MVRRVGIALLFLGYMAGIVWWLAAVVVDLFLPPMNSLFGFALGHLFGAAIVLWALPPPVDWRRLATAGTVVIIGMLVFWFHSPLTRFSDRLFVSRSDLNAFAAEIRTYGRIDHMWRVEGHLDWLNGAPVAHTEAGRDSVTDWYMRWHREPPELLATILQRDAIDPAVYRRFQQQLARFHFRGLSMHGDYIVFTRGRIYGLAHASEGAPTLEAGEKIPGTDCVITRALGGGWYFWVE